MDALILIPEEQAASVLQVLTFQLIQQQVFLKPQYQPSPPLSRPIHFLFPTFSPSSPSPSSCSQGPSGAAEDQPDGAGAGGRCGPGQDRRAAGRLLRRRHHQRVQVSWCCSPHFFFFEFLFPPLNKAVEHQQLNKVKMYWRLCQMFIQNMTQHVWYGAACSHRLESHQVTETHIFPTTIKKEIGSLHSISCLISKWLKLWIWIECCKESPYHFSCNICVFQASLSMNLQPNQNESHFWVETHQIRNADIK